MKMEAPFPENVLNTCYARKRSISETFRNSLIYIYQIKARIEHKLTVYQYFSYKGEESDHRAQRILQPPYATHCTSRGCNHLCYP